MKDKDIVITGASKGISDKLAAVCHAKGARLVLPVAGLALGGRAWWDVGRFLGPNISGHYRRWPLTRLLDAWHAAGMTNVEYRVMSVGGGIVMWGIKRA